jgi:hypothetical protein
MMQLWHLLKGDGKGNFTPLSAQQSGINIRGAVRDLSVSECRQKTMLDSCIEQCACANN